jgi:hypothetical protein
MSGEGYKLEEENEMTKFLSLKYRNSNIQARYF